MRQCMRLRKIGERNINGGNIDAARTPSIPMFKYYVILMKFKTIDSTVCGFETAIGKQLKSQLRWRAAVGSFCSTKRLPSEVVCNLQCFFLIVTEKR